MNSLGLGHKASQKPVKREFKMALEDLTFAAYVRQARAWPSPRSQVNALRDAPAINACTSLDGFRVQSVRISMGFDLK